ncbi:unnamed protein product [Urochloa decumbens]|uniref:F-box domain-containing protein n=1 Tax=Urochloa decumbens TaxID=240449 RepID=A0ABC9GCL2_9POAL
MAAAAPAPALMEELVEEVLLRFPPDDPASLVRAALVSKRWCRLVSGRCFRRRFRERHRAATVLGVICRMDDHAGLNNGEVSSFVPTGSFRPRRADRRDWVALDARHGRVLLLIRPLQSIPGFVVWDPVTREEWEVPPSPRCPHAWNAALLCAAGGECDHLDCRSGPFLVVVVASIGGRKTYVDLYSSEANAWTEQASVQHTGNNANAVDWLLSAGVLLGNSVYFMLRSHKEILEYNLCTLEISKIQLPPVSDRPNALAITANGRLGFYMIHNTKVYLWLREANPEGDARWARTTVIELETLLPAGALMDGVRVVGFVDGVSLMFVQTSNELFAIDLKSQQARKMCERHSWYTVIPYESFYTPALRAASTGEEYGAGASRS